jgi:peptidyl-dipeptidase A
VPAGKPIPAQLLGNMWSQAWNNISDDILKPYPAASIETADRQLKAQKWDAVKMTRSAESFYTSLGFQQLPKTFWDRSMLVRPKDREVVCHASAWNMDPDVNDVRIKMCMTPSEEDLFTVYHELGHVYYYLSYNTLPNLFRSGANDGFHEAIGDTVNLSVTPGYLAKIGLINAVKPSQEAVINQQMKLALDKIAFLPFGRLIDQWRWKVFSGEITPDHYNEAWWELRRKYQGIAPPVARTEKDFDPGAKFHIPDNTPYTRYFLSYILQFQFHKALCDASGYKGPLHECSVFGNKEAGKRYQEMLSLGASQPWPATLEKLTGKREMDASAIIEYFQPLIAWLKEQNKSQQCGWN